MINANSLYLCIILTGRQFYSCPRPSDSRCGFFLWADTADDGDSLSRQSGFSSYNSIWYETQLVSNTYSTFVLVI